jgi:hypothetical protein
MPMAERRNPAAASSQMPKDQRTPAPWRRRSCAGRSGAGGYPLAVTLPASSALRIPVRRSAVRRSDVGHRQLATMLVGRRVLSDDPLEFSLRRRLGRNLGRFNPRPGPKAAPDRLCPSAILELPHIPTSGQLLSPRFRTVRRRRRRRRRAANSIANGTLSERCLRRRGSACGLSRGSPLRVTRALPLRDMVCPRASVTWTVV